MKKAIFCTAGHNKALFYAAEHLQQAGYEFADPGPEITHLLLPVPSFEADGTIKGGGHLSDILSALPTDVVIIGGNISHGYPAVDLLSDPFYLSENAAITAHCTLKYILNSLPVTMDGLPVLVIGWGRIGKCLGQLLSRLGAHVTIMARKASDRAMASALGYNVTDLNANTSDFRVILNTAPAPVLTEAQIARCRPNCLKIDLASKISIPGSDVIWARGLPGKDAPESSGALIAKTVIRLIEGKECPI